jgi:hypothetical protein
MLTFREVVALVYGGLAVLCGYAAAFEADGPAAVWTTAAMGAIFAGVAAGALWWRTKRWDA